MGLTTSVGSSGFDPSKGQSDKDGSASPLGIPSLQKKSPVQVKSTTSGSSRDQSDDDELDLDTETTQNMDPADVKRVRRYLDFNFLTHNWAFLTLPPFYM